MIPPSLKAMVTQIKQNEKELDKVEKKLAKLGSVKATTSTQDQEIAKLQQAKVDLKQIISETRDELNGSIGNSAEITNLTSQLDVMKSKLNQVKTEANQTGTQIKEAMRAKALKDKEGIAATLENLKQKLEDTKNNFKSFSSKITKALSPKGIGKGIASIGQKVDGLKRRMTQLLLGAFVFNVLRQGLEGLKNGFMNCLKSNDTFNNSLAQIKGNLMTAFAPIYNAILPAINALMSGLTQLTATIATFVSSLFGTGLSTATKDAKKLSSALDDTAKSGEEASGSLASFDHLEVVGGSNGSSSGGSSDNSTGIDYSAVTQTNSKLLEILNQIKSMISSGDWGGLAQLISQAFVNALNTIQEKISSIDWSGMGSSISAFLSNIDWSGILVGLTAVLGEAVVGFSKLLLAMDWGTILGNFSSGIADAIQEAADYIWSINWGGIGQALSDAITGIDWLGIGNSILNIIWQSLMGLVDLFLGIDWSAVGTTFSEAVSGWIDTLITMFTETDWLQLGEDIANAIMDFLLNIDWLGLGENLIKGLVEGLIAGITFIVSALTTILDRILEFFGIHSPSTVFKDMGIDLIRGLINGISSLISSVVSVFSNIFTSAKQAVVSIITGIINFIIGLPGKIANALKTIPEKFKEAFQNAKNKVASIWKSVTSIFSKGGKIFDGIKEGIADTFKTIVNGLISGINKVIKVPFDKINGLLNNIRSISIAGVEPFKKLWSKNPLPVPQLPKLASGAVIPPRQEFAAILGDQKHGTNIEAPLETIKQANREVLEEFFNKLDSFGFNDTDKEVIFKNLTFVLQFGSSHFQKFVIDTIRAYENEIGKQLLVS